jgi:alpha-L-rhamnosidase
MMMKKNLIILLVLFISGIQLAFANVVASSLQPENLRCEYLENPIGLDELNPRFNWTHKATNAAAFGQKLLWHLTYRYFIKTGEMNGILVG